MGAKKFGLVAEEREVHELAMRQIEVLPELFQTRAAIDPAVVAAFAEQIRQGFARAFPPVLVARTPDGRLILADGFHRHAAHVKRRSASIRAIIRDVKEDREALLLGIGANLDPATHRKPGEDDRRHAVEMVIRDEEFRTWSDSHISRVCGMSQSSVQKIRAGLAQREGIPLPGRVKQFRGDGSSTGKMTRYHVDKNRKDRYIGVVIRNGRIGHRASIGGSLVSLGADPDEARRRVEEQMGRRSINRPGLNVAKFGDWLFRRGIATEASSPHGARTRDDVTMIPAALSDHDSILRYFGIAFLVRQVRGYSGRIIMVGYWDEVSHFTHQVIALARGGDHPVEFLTPEQVVAEFGPKPDGADGPDTTPTGPSPVPDLARPDTII